ncbi:hypothetical protein NKI38_19480 [Mesorhizobium sp. M0621]|uniref:hypothetical protein n=1 Tax=Mesorhizobium sp. M0621 TaxID=2956974 RepID=UPI0033380438
MRKFLKILVMTTSLLGCSTTAAQPSAHMTGVSPQGQQPDARGLPLKIVGNFKDGVDSRLMDILNIAAQRFGGYRVEAYSGFRAGDPRFHGKGMAADIWLVDLKTGRKLPNYQDPSTFRIYEQFAQIARIVQLEKYPELTGKFRWGGYFSGPKGKYGATDEMHFDLGGGTVGMGGGSWENGLTPAQRALLPGVVSVGMGGVGHNG